MSGCATILSEINFALWLDDVTTFWLITRFPEVPDTDTPGLSARLLGSCQDEVDDRSEDSGSDDDADDDGNGKDDWNNTNRDVVEWTQSQGVPPLLPMDASRFCFERTNE